MIIHEGFTKDIARYELTYLEPDTDDEITVTISDYDHRLDISERIKKHNNLTFSLERQTRKMLLNAGRFAASVLHDSDESSLFLDNIEKNIKIIRSLLL